MRPEGLTNAGAAESIPIDRHSELLLCTTVTHDKRLREDFSELYAENKTNGYSLKSKIKFLNRQPFLSMLT